MIWLLIIPLVLGWLWLVKCYFRQAAQDRAERRRAWMRP